MWVECVANFGKTNFGYMHVNMGLVFVNILFVHLCFILQAVKRNLEVKLLIADNVIVILPHCDKKKKDNPTI